MTTKTLIEFCPAAAIAAELVRLETLIEIADRLSGAAARSADCLSLVRGLEAIHEDLILAAEDTRGRLASVTAVSAAGAIAQLLAAIRDTRVRDDDEHVRALGLEAQAIGFAVSAGMAEEASARRLSQTRVARLAPAETRVG